MTGEVTYLAAPHPLVDSPEDSIHALFESHKHSIALTIAGSFRLLADGLFLQSGMLLRSAVESSLVALDASRRPAAISELRSNKYESQSILRRVKGLVPTDVVRWYGYFSANFTHTAALHQAPYLPRACYPDNWVIVTGLQNILRAVVTYHIALERAHASLIAPQWFWVADGAEWRFNESSPIFTWAQNLGAGIQRDLPTDKPPPGMVVSPTSIRLKT